MPVGGHSWGYRLPMPKFMVGWLLSLATAAIALILCALLLPGFEMHPAGFVVSILLFAILSGFFTWALFEFLTKHAATLVPLTGLVAAYLSLLLCDVLTRGLSIDGFWTWVWATVIVWIISMVVWVIPGPWRKLRLEREADKKD